MSQQPSLPQSLQTVQLVLTGNSGKPISQMQVAALLDPFQIFPKTIWYRGQNGAPTSNKGYALGDCKDAFEHNLEGDDAADAPRSLSPSSPESAFSPVRPSDLNGEKGLEALSKASEDPPPGALENSSFPYGPNGSDGLTGENGNFADARKERVSNTDLTEQPDPNTEVSTSGITWSEIERRIAVENANFTPPDTAWFDDFTRDAEIRKRAEAQAVAAGGKPKPKPVKRNGE